MNCPHCNKPVKLVAASSSFGDEPAKPAPAAGVKISNHDAFRELCSLMLRAPGCTDEKFRSALEDFPGKAKQYGSLTSGQAKFFKAMHFQILGTWPPDLDKLQAPEQRMYSAAELENIPF